MSDLARPLDPAAVKAADDAFYANHPEFIGPDGKRIPLSATDPAQAALRREWRNAYVAAGGPVNGGDSNKPPGGGAEPCPPCPNHPPPGGGPGGGTDPKPPPPGTEPGKPVPTLTVRWSKPWVTPDHNSSWPPASAPTDIVPEEAKVELIGETTNVPDGTTATMTISHCQTDAAVPDGAFTELEVRGGKVLDIETGKPPVFVFDASHRMWDIWNQPWFRFRCDVAYEGLSESTPKDFEAQAADCLRVVYWHVCFSESSTLSGVFPEVTEIAGILGGVPHSRSMVQDTQIEDTPLADYGSTLRNTYVFHQASHGNALRRSDNAYIPEDDPGETLHNKAEWRSIVHITPLPHFGDAQIGNAASVPSTPRYLYYASTCLTGWEPSFADAMMARGTDYVLAFRRTIPDAEAPILARKFYNRWVGLQLDPSKIADCFFATAQDHYAGMKPILYGAGGAAIEPSVPAEVGDTLSGLGATAEDVLASLSD